MACTVCNVEYDRFAGPVNGEYCDGCRVLAGDPPDSHPAGYGAGIAASISSMVRLADLYGGERSDSPFWPNLPDWPTTLPAAAGLPPIVQLILPRAESTYKVYRTVYEEVGKGIMGHDVDTARVDRALDDHLKDQGLFPGGLWTRGAIGHAYMNGAEGASKGSTSNGSAAALLHRFPSRVVDALKDWLSRVGSLYESFFGKSQSYWAEHSRFTGGDHDMRQGGFYGQECTRCGMGWAFGEFGCSKGPCENCKQPRSAHHEATRACAAQYAPPHLR